MVSPKVDKNISAKKSQVAAAEQNASQVKIQVESAINDFRRQSEDVTPVLGRNLSQNEFMNVNKNEFLQSAHVLNTNMHRVESERLTCTDKKPLQGA
jgi:hypothetical protein